MAENPDFGRFWPENLASANFDRKKPVLVDFGRKIWLGSILTGKTDFRRFWPRNWLLLDCGSK